MNRVTRLRFFFLYFDLGFKIVAKAESPERSLKNLDADTKERNYLKALDGGLLKIMAKSGISVVRSYQSAKLYSALGLGKEIIQEYFGSEYKSMAVEYATEETPLTKVLIPPKK